eukprot:COSAG04_NODE_209_length_20232_cov_116.817315_31_plen_345_part_00
MTGSPLPALKPRGRIFSVEGKRETKLIVDRVLAAKHYGPAALPKLLPPRGSKADRRRRATAAEIRADRGQREEWRSSGLQVLVGGRGGVPALGPRGDDILVLKTRRNSFGSSAMRAAISGETMTSGRHSAEFSLHSSSDGGAVVVGVCRADADPDSDVFSSGGWGYDMLSGQAVCARSDSRLRWESKLPTSETQDRRANAPTACPESCDASTADTCACCRGDEEGGGGGSCGPGAGRDGGRAGSVHQRRSHQHGASRPPRPASGRASTRRSRSQSRSRRSRSLERAPYGVVLGGGAGEEGPGPAGAAPAPRRGRRPDPSPSLGARHLSSGEASNCASGTSIRVS